MNNLLINPETITLLQGLKPYLGQKGTALTEGISKVMNIAASDVGKELIQMLAHPSFLGGSNSKTFSLRSGKAPIDINSGLPFVLFLVFVLLLFSGNSSAK